MTDPARDPAADPVDRAALVEVVRRGLLRSEEPLTLASGHVSHWFLDVKLALAGWDEQELVGRAIAGAASRLGVEFDAVGGLTLGADWVSPGVSCAARRPRFSIRKQAKGRGTNRFVEGCRIGPGSRVLVVDDVVTTGGSILQAVDRVAEVGAQVVFAATVVDRGELGGAEFSRRGIPYEPVLTYVDLGIPAIGDEGADVPPE